MIFSLASALGKDRIKLDLWWRLKKLLREPLTFFMLENWIKRRIRNHKWAEQTNRAGWLAWWSGWDREDRGLGPSRQPQSCQPHKLSRRTWGHKRRTSLGDFSERAPFACVSPMVLAHVMVLARVMVSVCVISHLRGSHGLSAQRRKGQSEEAQMASSWKSGPGRRSS